MFRIVVGLFVFIGGFIIMALEIVGARYLARDFGGAFYVWVSQIGVILIALALGYAAGGALADRWRRASYLAAPLAMAGLFIYLIPTVTPPLLDAIVMRHPSGQEIPGIWMKVDPAIGSALVFFLPCFALAILSPYMARVTAPRLENVGMTSGLIYSASTAGSIASVFVSGYVFIDYLSITTIFHAMGCLALLLAGLSLVIDRLSSRGVA